MKNVYLIITALILFTSTVKGQSIHPDTIWVGKSVTGKQLNSNVGERPSTYIDWYDGYMVYNGDTMKGYFQTSKFDILFQKPINDHYAYYFVYQKNDPILNALAFYNYKDKKPLYLKKLENPRKLFRVIHQGKLNIYDDRPFFIYKTHDIDKNNIVVEYNGEIDHITSFLPVFTKSDLIGYINEIYGLHLVPKELSWQELLIKIDELD